jgi:Protein of unknown function (DUF3237)
MITLDPLCMMTLQVNAPLDAGAALTGRRMIGEIASAELSGRLCGHLAGTSSADWFTMTAAGIALADVRLAIETDDGAIVLIRYGARFRPLPDQPAVVMIAPVFDTGDSRYGWLNEIQAVGKGLLSTDRTRLDYEIYQLH